MTNNEHAKRKIIINEYLIDKKEVARLTGYSLANVQRLVNERKLPHYKLERAVRFKASEIKDWIDSFKVERSF